MRNIHDTHVHIIQYKHDMKRTAYEYRVYGVLMGSKITKGNKGEIRCMDARGVMIISEMIYLNLKYGRHINGNECREKHTKE